MDKNEIIERLGKLARCAVHTVGELPFVMSLDDGIAIHEAIDMLRSQPEPHWIPCSVVLPKTCNQLATDCINRQAAIDALDKRFDSIPMNQTTEILLLRKDLRELPPTQPERKRGRWIRQRNKAKPLYGWFFCSECGAFCGGETNFCSECGADMREVDDERV